MRWYFWHVSSECIKLLWIAFCFPFRMIGCRLMRINTKHMTFLVERWVGEVHKMAKWHTTRDQRQVDVKSLKCTTDKLTISISSVSQWCLLLEMDKYDGTELMSYTDYVNVMDLSRSFFYQLLMWLAHCSTASRQIIVQNQ